MMTGKPNIGRLPVPGDRLPAATVPAHWLLARLGKRVMRPGGLEVTTALLHGLAIGPGDDVVDLAPELGVTAALVLASGPASFTGLERGDVEAARATSLLDGAGPTCLVAQPDATGLPDASASVVYGEAVLTLETDETKERILAEAARLLRPGGRLGLHELLLVPDELSGAAKREMQETLTRVLRVRARPLTLSEWRDLLEQAGFEVVTESSAPLLLLSPGTFVRDETPAGTARFLANALREPGAVARLGSIWTTFRRYRRHLGSVAITARRR